MSPEPFEQLHAGTGPGEIAAKPRCRVLILGGGGNFGARITRALSGDSCFEVWIGSRTACTVHGAPLAQWVSMDWQAADFAERLRTLAPNLVIHCVGPFQGQDYRVAEACIALGAHCIDLSDGRAFVAGFHAQLHARAQAAGVSLITGASTLPALSSAVVDALSANWQGIDAIDSVIAPGQKAARGVATLAAVFSYLGRAFDTWRAGRWQKTHGWMHVRRVHLPFGTRFAAACDVPDLALFPSHYPGVQTVEFHAALEIGLQHGALWVLAALRRWGMPLDVSRLAIALNRFAPWFDRFASPCGGMRVAVRGVNENNQAIERVWALQIEASNGPEIPCFAAILLARKLANGEAVPRGAWPCLSVLRLAEFEPLFSQWSIQTSISETTA